ncbi:transcriptional regulator, GntR family [Peribacillus simplex]|uniref:Transcriptional regulator, GntR family n=1 Tax=Peribacillus simplex TaxID=1478 RepID=A0A9X8RD77_9BACI|nr:GntR family transcriptional regulator [Peribacillus simplex]SIR97768.1 transcriptional regulator, GntR family [Peribacillus simplex]
METNHYQYITEQIEHYSSKPLREAIFFVIKNAIIEGIFLPGDRLTEDDIAQQFNCSRTPVREALRKLEQENLLQVKPGIGMVISNVDIELLHQELEIRKMLENYSIQKACEGITEEELKKLEWATDKLQQAINSNDRIAASRANIEFHRLLYSYSRNTFLQKTTDSLWLSFRISFLSARNEDVTMVDKSWYEERNNEHLQLIQAIRDKDVEKAIRVNTIHIQKNYDYYLDYIKRVSE